jgi:hypothetical protein
MANDPVATGVHGTPEMCLRVEQSHAQPSGEEESRCGNSTAIGREFVESVYGTSGSGETRVVVPAVPIFENHGLNAFRKRVTGVVYDTSHNISFFLTTWIDPLITE